MTTLVEYETKLRDGLAECAIPSYMHGSILNYILYGIPPGSFLSAIITNDLREAVSRADSTNVSLIANYVKFFYNHAPLKCWGSDEFMFEWIEMKKLERLGTIESK